MWNDFYSTVTLGGSFATAVRAAQESDQQGLKKCRIHQAGRESRVVRSSLLAFLNGKTSTFISSTFKWFQRVDTTKSQTQPDPVLDAPT